MMKFVYIYICSFLSFVSGTFVIQPLSAMGSANQSPARSEIVLQTEGGIADGKRCTLYKEQLQGTAISEYIVCDDGTRYDAPVFIESSAADTSPPLEYTNYIGSYLKLSVPRPIPIMRMPGEGESLLYFDGEPQKRMGGQK